MDRLDRHLRMTGNHISVRGRNRGPDRLAELGDLVGGQIVEHQGMRCLVRHVEYEAGFVHGDLTLGSVLSQDGNNIDAFAYGDGSFDPAKVAYLDLETTGLRNAMAFLVGLGFFSEGRFVLCQYFVPAPPDEEAMLALMNEDLQELSGLVTFNGRSFDWPLLCDRFVRSASRPQLYPFPHLDLLLVARRLWKRSLSSCSLSSVEQNCLGVIRKSHDIPGAEVPAIYDDYVRAGEIGPLEGVFYHNEVDILSLVTLTSRVEMLLDLEEPHSGQEPAECLSLGRMFEAQAFSLGSDRTPEHLEYWLARAMSMYRYAAGSSNSAIAGESSERLGLMLKRWARNGRDEDRVGHYDMAMEVWQSQLDRDIIEPYIELAKVYEHQSEYRDLPRARQLTVEAMRVVKAWRPVTLSVRETWAELAHRLRRLETKQGISQSENR